MLCRDGAANSKKKTGSVPVYLNVYDLTPMNGYAYWLGLGIYHSGVLVHGVEYAFGAHEHSTTGIFEVEPRKCPGFTFRKSILIGTTDMNPKEVGAVMEKLAEEYRGNKYHLICKNCNHFCNDVCLRLTGKQIPRWVNRLARLGFLCNCVLPASLNNTKVRQVKAKDKTQEVDKKKFRSRSVKSGSEIEEGEKKKLRSRSTRLVSSSSSKLSPNAESSCPSPSAQKQRHSVHRQQQ